MFKSYHNIQTKTLGSIFLASTLFLTACGASEPKDSVKAAADAIANKAKVAESTTVTKVHEKVAQTEAKSTSLSTKKAAVATPSDNMGGSATYANGKFVIDGGVTYPVKNGKIASYAANTQEKKGFTYVEPLLKMKLQLGTLMSCLMAQVYLKVKEA